MSQEAAVSVPGKTILLGEHAAVYGHPALVTAVDLRLSVVARKSDVPGVTITGSPEFRTGTLSWNEVKALHRSSEPPAGRLAFLAAGAAAAHAGVSEAEGITLTVRSDIPPGSGLGSSAALAVGVSAAVFAAAGVRAEAATIARVALEVETRQHGRPSGVDVSAVLRGGTLWCRRGEAETLEVDRAKLARLELYHTGTPTESTGEMVAAVARLAEADPGRVSEAMAAIDAATHEARAVLADALQTDVVTRLIPLLSRAEAALESLEVVPPAVAAAIRAIEAAGGAAKISGAGGRSSGAGLVVVLPGDRPMRVPSGWTRLPFPLGAPGLREEVAA